MVYSSFDYLFLNKGSEKEILSFKAANNLRLSENEDLTNSYQIGEKTSNFFTESIYTPNDFLSIKYSLVGLNYQNLIQLMESISMIQQNVC